MSQFTVLPRNPNHRRWVIGAFVFLLPGVAAGFAAAPAAPPAREPGAPAAVALLKARCGGCHGPTGGKAGLDLSSPEGVFRGAESGPVIVPGKPGESLLLRTIHEGRMPPKGLPRLTPAEIEAVRAWIETVQPPASPVSRHAIIPLMNLRCTVCHGLRRQEGGLDLRTRESMLRGGKSGPAIVVGKPAESLLLKRVHNGEMPPPRRVVEVSVKPMEPTEVELVTRWIAAGAPWSEPAAEGSGLRAVGSGQKAGGSRSTPTRHWSFVPPRAVRPPAFEAAARVTHPIDAFVLRELRKKGLGFAPEADRLTLLRRATFDLTGLPPTPEEAAQFLRECEEEDRATLTRGQGSGVGGHPLRDPHAGTPPLAKGESRAVRPPTPRAQRVNPARSAGPRAGSAYERLIDRLLASPRYGERWGRHWLDLAGYSDSEGIQDADPVRPDAWRYRDYVIRSFNADKPYNRFLLEQIAGDELADYENAPEITQELADNLTATGFLRLTTDGTFSPITAFVPDRLDVIADEMTVLTSSVMGLTMRCARCHSHKFDPIPHRDYYKLLAVFKGALDEHDWLSPHGGANADASSGRFRLLPFVPTAERRAWEAREQGLTAEVQQLRETLARKAQEIGKSTGSEAKDADLRKQNPEFRKLAEETEARIKQVEAKREPQPLIRALWDRGEPTPTYVYKRGNYLTPGEPVEPGVPSALEDPRAPYVVRPPWPGAKKTGRRLAFAKWLVRPEHPLTGRVIVNRVWHHHFGQGLVKTLDNFGKTGARPTHPELLDYLAVAFATGSGKDLTPPAPLSGAERRESPLTNAVRGATGSATPTPPHVYTSTQGLGWSLKRLHRLIMTSRAYRQVSTVRDEARRLDPENRLLSRMRMRRMEAEVLHDSLLSVAGKLDLTPFGKPDGLEARADGLVQSAGSARGWRRSVYVLQRRKQPLSLLEAFDLPQMSPNCVVRSETTASPQALQLLNNGRIQQLAAAFAARVRGQAGDDPGRQVDAAYWVALGRPPTAQERQLGLEALDRFRKVWATSGSASAEKALETYCHALLNSAEFLYVD